MFKKVTALLLCMLLLPCLILSVSGDNGYYIVDNAGLLSTEEITALEENASELALSYNIDPVILTVESLDGKSAQEYADGYYDMIRYREDGVLFLLAMAEREWYISTSGTVIFALTDFGVQELGEGVAAYLTNGDWYNGFRHYLHSLPNYLDAYQSGTPIDGQADYSGTYYHADQEEILYYEEEASPSLLLSLLCGIVAAGITVFVMRLSMNTKRTQRTATDYMKDGSWDLYQHRDLFLYSNVTKTRRQENKPSGGSSVHHSSSGRRHGGGGGKF